MIKFICSRSAFHAFWVLMLVHTGTMAEVLPVMVGGNEDLDACMSVGVIQPAKSLTDVNIYSGPSTAAKVTAHLPEGRFVWICSEQKGWVGIVYPASNEKFCEVSEPITPAQPYLGECQSGWVPAKFVELVAG